MVDHGGPWLTIQILCDKEPVSDPSASSRPPLVVAALGHQDWRSGRTRGVRELVVRNGSPC